MSKKHFMAAAAAGSNSNDVTIIPLRDWMTTEIERVEEKFHTDGGNQSKNNVATSFTSKESIIRKTTIAYGILESILRFLLMEDQTNDSVADLIEFDNFSVHVAKKPPKRQQWDDIKGVSMLSPKISLTIEEPAYLSCLFEPGENRNVQYGRHLEVEQTSNESEEKEKEARKQTGADEAVGECGNMQGNGEKNKQRYHLVAKILYVLFTNEAYLDDVDVEVSSKEPAQKKAKSLHHQDTTLSSQQKEKAVNSDAAFQVPSVKRMQQIGVPASLCLMVHNLLEASQSDYSGDAYTSMKDVVRDLHLLLLDPDRFLFDADVEGAQSMALCYRKGKLYGRDEEEKLITDAFCRVTRGHSEAFFIGGFSGCGKSMLVDTLRSRVKVVGGYVIKHKFDALSQERPLSGVISAVNQLCAMIQGRCTPTELELLLKRMGDEFNADKASLGRILQGISVLSSDFICPDNNDENNALSDTMNARSVGHTLLRFLRLVSSRSHPIMLFLDDLQWADETALDLVHTFLHDNMGSCIFFVGTYRDNEVEADHPVFNLMNKLESSNVPTSKMALAGLSREDLNTMISDALCLYPRMCHSLTDIVMQKTTGNPFFMLEFMKSLKDRGLLHYNIYQRRWMWDKVVIRAENITDNVMHLLSHKMTALPDSLQMVLKVMACFGTFTNESVIGSLDNSIAYAGIGDGLKRAVDGGFVERSKLDEFKFVHDKIREAAYNLIPESEKNQFHYNLGTVLNSSSKEEDNDDSILIIASQLYLGKECIPKDDELCIPIVKLIMDAGKKSIESCHHETAYRYLEAASSLLPDDCWERYYDDSLRLNFLTANAANASCKYDKAQTILKKILSEGRCVEDKLPSYYLLSQIFLGQGQATDTYEICSSILTQLGETVPDKISCEEVQTMNAETVEMYDEVLCDDWLETKMEDRTLHSVLKLYSAIVDAAYFCQDEHVAHYLICKMVQVSLRTGICQSTPFSFIHLSYLINVDGSKAALANRIANVGMSISKKFNFSPDQMAGLACEYVYSVGYLEWFHLGVRRLRSVFESALSSGNAGKAFYSAALSIILSIISGEKKLTLLLKEIDYYLHILETYNNEGARNFLIIYRKTVSMLIDKGDGTSIGVNDDVGEGDALPQVVLDMVNVNGTIQSYWAGYKQRCCHFAQKCFDSFPSPGRKFRVIVTFYYGLTLIEMLKTKSKSVTRKQKEIREIVDSMRVAVSHAGINFRNKLELLQAEQYALVGHHSNAVTAYDAAIASAKKREFIHEQGLACEKAGLYFKSIKKFQKAVGYLEEARTCYDEWGSTLRVEMMEKELSALKG